MPDLASCLRLLRICPDPMSGRFILPVAIRQPDMSTAAPVSKFYVRDGKLFDGFNHEWSEAEFEKALTMAGLLPQDPVPDRIHCAQCGKRLRGMQTLYCGPDCARASKRESMRRKRHFSGHKHVCRECGKV